ncbi:uncharacterized protein A4U43_C06F10560 [Asparagus officinalis]|uniref:Reticulon-like protein n=2 Tax=Asparagus officinalis TaxID=4686 RepID=A0A5P1EQ27_ASPOF|nr:uncharacterized protein A4U43_C06F10560 [Asparagus officinalis]
MWRDKRSSAAVLIGGTLAWFLFEVLEYNLLTLLCHVSIMAMLVVFLWSNAAALMNWTPPKIPDVILSERAFKEVAVTFHHKFNQFSSILHHIASGKDLKLFLMAIGFLWIISVIGSCFSALNLLYFVFVCIQTLPALYEHYEYEVDHLTAKGMQELKKLYRNLDSRILSKIPRGPAVVKEKL